MRSEQQERLNHFLEDVDEQIAYKPIHAAVNEELRAHVEDKAEIYMEYGIEEDEAYEKAIRDMGDASVIGIQMNETHHLRIAKPLLTAILILTALAAAGNRQPGGGPSPQGKISRRIWRKRKYMYTVGPVGTCALHAVRLPALAETCGKADRIVYGSGWVLYADSLRGRPPSF